MPFRLAVTGLALMLLSACQSTPPLPPAEIEEPTPALSPTFEPARGVVCHRQRRVCEFRGGATVGLTRLFFGDEAAERIEAAAARDAYRHDPLFHPDLHSTCDTLVTTCYGVAGPDRELTARVFGDDAVSQLDTRMGRGALERRGGTVTCDKTTGICYDRLGAGYGLTRLYLGEETAENMLRRLQHWRSPR